MFDRHHFTLILMAKKSALPCCWESSMTPSRPLGAGRTPCESPPPFAASFGRLGLIYDSQLAGIHKNTTTNRWKLLYFDWKIAKTRFFCTNLEQDIILIHFVRNRSRKKNIFSSGHLELYLFKITGVIYAPAIGMSVNYDTFSQWLICTALFMHIKTPYLL